MEEIIGNDAVEDAAIAWVLELERAAGRDPRDVRHGGGPTDLESAPRLIEMKAYGTLCRGQHIWLETHQIQEARANPDFHVYVVENVRQGDPKLFTLKVLGGEHLRRLLVRAKKQSYYTVPWPVADYDSCPNGLDQKDP